MTTYPRPRRSKVYFLMFAGAISIGLLVMGVYQMVEFMDTDAFCGRLCHDVMYPEYTVYQDSPHSRVNCVACHVGSGADYLVRSKLSGIPQIIATLTANYPRPIPTPVRNLRPARDTCEQCHRPERFAGDLVRTHTTYQTDEVNTPRVDTRVLRVGGGELGEARDIHWHVGADVWYLPMDKSRLEIGWVGVELPDGGFVEYIDPARTGEITPKRIESEKRLMDCMDCHNRATHVFRSPEELVDAAMVQGRIDVGLPFIKREAVKALDPPKSSLEEAYRRVDEIKQFYQSNYPEIYSTRGAAIDRTIVELRNVARLTTFPDMKVTSKTYIDHMGHQTSPGCLRCHGRLVERTDGSQARPIDASCDSCHYLTIK